MPVSTSIPIPEPTNAVTAALDGLKIDIAAHRPAGVTEEKHLVNTVTALYKRVHIINLVNAVDGLCDFGVEHGATFVAFPVNNESFEDTSYLEMYPMFYAADGSVLGNLDPIDHEADRRISEWIEADRDRWITDQVLPGISTDSDVELAALMETTKHDYLFRCTKVSTHAGSEG